MISHEYFMFEDQSIHEALVKINNNQSRIVFIVDKEMYLSGLLTDGDIRRALICCASIDNKVSSFLKKDFFSLEVDAGFDDLAGMFSIQGVEVLPITKDGVLVSFITRSRFESLVLHGVSINLNQFVDEPDTSNEAIVVRPWGFYKTTFINQYSQSKIICVRPGQELSLQEHKLREEHWVVTKGSGKVVLGDTVKVAFEGMYFFIPAGCKHQLKNDSDTENLIITEVQLGSYFGEDDIIRYSDKYGRLEK